MIAYVVQLWTAVIILLYTRLLVFPTAYDPALVLLFSFKGPRTMKLRQVLLVVVRVDLVA